MKSLYSSLALFLVVAAVGGWIYFQERGPIAESGATVLLRAEPQSVSSLVLAARGGARLEMTRQKNGWQVHRAGTNSVAVPADEEMIDALLGETQLIQSGAIIEAGSTPDAAKLKEFGLDAARSTLVVGDAKIEFGVKPAYDPSKIYARVTNNAAPQIALLPAKLADLVSKPFNVWRDKSTLRVNADDVTKLRVRALAFDARFERILKGENGEDDQWQMLAPVKTRGDAGTIKALLQQLAFTQTSQFLEDNPKNLARWGLDKPIAEVEVTSGEGARILRIGKIVKGGRVAQNSISQVLFVVPDSLLAIISRPLRDWRDRKVLRFSTGDVQNLSVWARGQKAAFASDGKVWTQTGASAKSAIAGAQAALDIMIGLQSLNAQDFIDKPQASSVYGLDKPALEAELSGSEWDAKKIKIGAKNGKLYAQIEEGSDSDKAICVLAPNALEPFKIALDVLFSQKKN